METGYLSRTDTSGNLHSRELPKTMLGWVLYRCGLVIFGLLFVFLSSTLCGCGAMNGFVMNRSGQRYYNKGNYEYARYEFERALMDDPHNANYAYNVARTMELEGEHENAERMYQHALTLNPNHLPSYHSLASMLREQGRDAESRELLVAWAETQPYSYNAQTSVAGMYQQEGNAFAAQRHYQQAERNLPIPRTPRGGFTQSFEPQYQSQHFQHLPQQYSPGMSMYGEQPQMVMQGGMPPMSSPRYPYQTPPSLQMATTMPENDFTMQGGPVVPHTAMVGSPVYQQSFPQAFPQMPVDSNWVPTPAGPTHQQNYSPSVPMGEPQLLPELRAPSIPPSAPQSYIPQQFSYQPDPQQFQQQVTAEFPQYPSGAYPSPQFPSGHTPELHHVMLPPQELQAPQMQPYQNGPALPQPVYGPPVQNISTQQTNQVVPAIQAF